MNQIERILRAVSSATRIRPLDMLSRGRIGPVNDARQIAMLFMRENLGLTHREIGRVFDGRDSTTVLSAIRSIRNKAETDGAVYDIIVIATMNLRSNTL